MRYYKKLFGKNTSINFYTEAIMITIISAVLTWFLVFILIPIERIRKIWPIAIISFILLFSVDSVFINLGYYRFNINMLNILNIPLFYLLSGAAFGILVLNWLTPKPWSKLIALIFFAGLTTLLEYIYTLYGAFVPLHNYDFLSSFILNTAGYSWHIWLTFTLFGEEKIYEGKKSRFHI